MDNKRKKVLHINSNVQGKQPTSDMLEYGEIALNYNGNGGFISFKDSEQQISRISDDKVMSSMMEYKEVVPYKADVNVTDLDSNKSEIKVTLNQKVGSKTPHADEINVSTGFSISMNGYVMNGSSPRFKNLTIDGDTTVNNFKSTGDSEISSLTVTDTANIKNLNVDGETKLNNLAVSGNSELENLTVKETINTKDLNASGNTIVNNLKSSGDTEFKNIIVTENSHFNNIDVSGNTTVNNFKSTGETEISSLTVTDSANIKDLTVEGETKLNKLEVSGDTIVNNFKSSGNTEIEKLTVNSSATINNLTVSGDTIVQNFKVEGTFETPESGDTTIKGETVVVDGEKVTISGDSITIYRDNTHVGDPLSSTTVDDAIDEAFNRSKVTVEYDEENSLYNILQDGEIRGSIKSNDDVSPYKAGDGENSAILGKDGQQSAKGKYSVAEGYATQANNFCEHAFGMYNASTTDDVDNGNNTIFSVGNGDAESRKNALEITRDGSIYLYVKTNNENKKVCLNELLTALIDKYID